MAFDPYYTWLAIAPEEQPPDHYRLLGLRRFEENLEVIENAADQRMMHLRNFQAGQHSALSQKLLNEVAAARVRLLNPEKKRGYDAQLRQAVRSVPGEPLPGGPPVLVLLAAAGKRWRSPMGIGLMVASVGLVLVLCVVAALSRTPVRKTTGDVEGRGTGAENPKLTLTDARLGPIHHDAIGKPVEVNVPYAPHYPGGGRNGLTDGRRAAKPEIYQPWQGYSGADVAAVIDLGKVQQIRCITTTFFQSHDFGVFLPSRVEYAVSQEGTEYRVVGTITNEPSRKHQPDACKAFTASGLRHTARYIRMQATNFGKTPVWQKSPGTPAWLFVDEILVNPVNGE
jgi:hypothetical protein